jgi:outer membrane protein TolC
LGLLLALLVLAGCKGVPAPGERNARHDLKTVADSYRPDDRKPELPPLSADAGLSNYLAYALLNSPDVAAAYYDWAASVERITVERSLPDPQLTFQAYIQNVITSLMPGFAWNFPGPGKLDARAAVATAGSKSKYFIFETAVLQSAMNLKRAGFELHSLDEQLRINRQNLALLNDLERIARAQNEVGKGTLQDVLRAQIERDRVSNTITNLMDSRQPKLASFKAALGLAYDQPDPPVPARLEADEVNPDSDEILRVAFTHNPKLKAMEADVRATEAGIAVAYKERIPDFNVALMADVKASPVLYWPQFGMTVPIWRDKLAAEVAAARANDLAARARLSAEQIALTVEFAEKSFACRELNRNLDLLRHQLIPKARQSLEIARAGYLAGTIDFFNLMNTEQTLLAFEMSEVEARTEREIALSELSLMIAGVPPPGAPILTSSAATKSVSGSTH